MRIYTLTEQLRSRLEKKVGSRRFRCRTCGETFKAGDLVVSTVHTRARAKYRHANCYENLQVDR